MEDFLNFLLNYIRLIHYVSNTTFSELIVTFGTVVFHIIHLTTAKWNAARKCATTEPAHCKTGTNLSASNLIIGWRKPFFVTLGACKLYRISLTNQLWHPLELPHLFKSNVVGILGNTLLFFVLVKACWGHRCHSDWPRSFECRGLWHLYQCHWLRSILKRWKFIVKLDRETVWIKMSRTRDGVALRNCHLIILVYIHRHVFIVYWNRWIILDHLVSYLFYLFIILGRWIYVLSQVVIRVHFFWF